MSDPGKVESEPQEGQTRPGRRGIYLLPNLLTTAAMFAGFFGIVAAIHGRFEAAAIAVFVAMLMDGLDGRVARLTHSESAFGAEYDSLSDMVSFGLAPSLIVYEWALVHMGSISTAWGRLGWLAAFIYAAAAALRLARFNVRHDTDDRRFFRGLPSPSAAAVMVGLVWASDHHGLEGANVMFAAFVVTVAVAGLMVSNVAYYSFKDLNVHKRVPFVAMLLIVLLFVFTTIDPPTVLFGGFMIYTLSGPAILAWRRLKRRRLRQSES
jgi:CDP-diacylglycerol--serine O-phosphatidyltransferase